jgi:hypothetical protein
VGGCCPIVLDVKWSNAKMIKIKYMVASFSHYSTNQQTTNKNKIFSIVRRPPPSDVPGSAVFMGQHVAVG